MGFDQTIKPMFREEDRASMDFAFDLWSFEDVKTNASLILERVEDGTMPCDKAWEEEKIEAFRAWMEADFPP
jgi:hypothetical protein